MSGKETPDRAYVHYVSVWLVYSHTPDGPRYVEKISEDTYPGTFFAEGDSLDLHAVFKFKRAPNLWQKITGALPTIHRWMPEKKGFWRRSRK